MPLCIEPDHAPIGFFLLIDLPEKMITDPESLSALEKDTGKYEWIIGDAGNQVVDRIRRNITERKLQDMVWWHENTYRFPSVYKPNLIVR